MYKHLTLASLTIRPGSTDILNAPSMIGGKHYDSEWKKLEDCEKHKQNHLQAEKKQGKICAG